MEVKIRVWDIDLGKMFYTDGITIYDLLKEGKECVDESWLLNTNHIPMQSLDLKDKKGQEYFVGDIGRFENGDTFVLKMEDWLEVYVDWIGEPTCEDQVRDLYRIRSAKIIGNQYGNPELIN